MSELSLSIILVIFKFCRARAAARELATGGRFSSSLSLSSSDDTCLLRVPRRPRTGGFPFLADFNTEPPWRELLVVLLRPLPEATAREDDEFVAMSLSWSSDAAPSPIASFTSRHSFKRVSNSATALFSSAFANLLVLLMIVLKD
uniref:Secreted protein n=1 Tax=Anopheles darlingi TaxID=43151 RepID=A0A2M4DDI9_ANODA